MEEFQGEHRCIASDLRNANRGQSSGPLEIDRPWDAHTDDHLGVMDHLGIDKFMVLGFCIGGPFIWNLLRRAPTRVVAAVLAQPSGWSAETPNLFYDNNMRGWGPELVERRPEITMDMVDRFLTRMYRTNADFVFTVTRDFVRELQTPILILPDDVPAHPYDVAMEAAMLAPQSEVSMFPWKQPRNGFHWRCARYGPSSGRIGRLPLETAKALLTEQEVFFTCAVPSLLPRSVWCSPSAPPTANRRRSSNTTRWRRCGDVPDAVELELM